MKNNLFYYATSELSQDAFICYLASFALDDVEHDAGLKECAKKMLQLFVPEINADAVHLENVERQVGHIDVLLSASCNGKRYKIIVEDKTFTSEHDNQLLRYVENIRSQYPDCEIKGVFYKTGFQSNLSSVEAANYNIITREKMLEFLEPFTETTSNQIVLEYYAYWKTFQEDVFLYKTLPIKKWNWKQIYGFYDTIKLSNFANQNNLWLDYGYVANKSGGFYGLWTGTFDDVIHIDGVLFEVYLQMETYQKDDTYSQICLKLSCKSDINVGEIKQASNKIIYTDDWGYRFGKYHFAKPNRVVSGRHMTIGIYDTEYQDAGELREVMHHAVDEYCKMLVDFKETER